MTGEELHKLYTVKHYQDVNGQAQAERRNTDRRSARTELIFTATQLAVIAETLNNVVNRLDTLTPSMGALERQLLQDVMEEVIVKIWSYNVAQA